MKRASINTCTLAQLSMLETQLFGVNRRELLLMAGARNNTEVLKDLGSAEHALWHEGRRAEDPDHINPYWPAR